VAAPNHRASPGFGNPQAAEPSVLTMILAGLGIIAFAADRWRHLP
jgi:hypothetical protein